MVPLFRDGMGASFAARLAGKCQFVGGFFDLDLGGVGVCVDGWRAGGVGAALQGFGREREERFEGEGGEGVSG